MGWLRSSAGRAHVVQKRGLVPCVGSNPTRINDFIVLQKFTFLNVYLPEIIRYIRRRVRLTSGLKIAWFRNHCDTHA